ncbi:squalene--hopene cyclase [Roseococcus sp. SYP-B2431]|uniref:squalene--hopene cyclase n=1 Tax=Roseococcus sp. SYP-B2431 TaxID=2496640 RepID=UPI0010397D19|nr:squalene--hopene cyclase [Roseococcus sp. SYP-B2431]TCH98400.1 squalene--hopene cyclase [Roseococcus sp. SYP-B2431]
MPNLPGSAALASQGGSPSLDSQGPDNQTLEQAVASAAQHLLAHQRADGHWVFELEADCTIPAEYVMLHHFFGRIQPEKEARIARYLRRVQSDQLGNCNGGWPLFHGGPLDISCSVKAYLALKLIGDPADAPHMVAARRAILAAGGAERSNVFTRSTLALFGAVPWRAVPMMPPEIMLLPRWFPFHVSKISYWARTVLIPLTVVIARQPKARNPTGATIDELFTTPPEQVKEWPGGAHQAEPWASLFKGLDGALHRARTLFPRTHRMRAEAACERFVTERLNGEDGLGAIYPAMANAVMMYHCMGVAEDDPRLVTAWSSIEKLVQERGPASGAGQEDAGETYVQPCLSPVWDTALASHALLEAGGGEERSAVARGLDWLLTKEITEVRGDWSWQRPSLEPGGWAFQYENAHYPDVDDTAVVVLAMDRFRKESGDGKEYDPAVKRATDWTVGMQSKGGGWGAFDADNTFHYLNHIPFADHGALLDPPTADVSGRCLAMLAQLGRGEEAASKQAIEYLLREQEADGSWYGRWGVNYVYGTWSALTALNAAGLPHGHQAMRRAVAWLVERQNEDGGWGEDGMSYPTRGGTRPDSQQHAPSSASQTAWAILALMAAGEADHPAVQRGAEWLTRHQKPDGDWPEEDYTGTGFPRVFYLRYHGYRRIFPLWALARLRNLRASNTRRVSHGL